MYLNNLNFFYKTGMFIGGVKTMDTELNKYNLVFFLGKKKTFFIINYKKFIYNIRICLFFLYRLISLRGKILAYDDRFYIRRCLIFFFKRANQNYVIKHWIGGTLTNFKKFKIFFFQIIKGFISVKKYYDLFLYYYGLKTMQQMPSLIIFTNPNGESVAFEESFRLAIPIVSLVDIVAKNTFGVAFPIPSNTTNKKSLIIFYSIIGDSLLYGFLKPVSYFFNTFLKRIKKIRKILLFQQKNYHKVYTSVFFDFTFKAKSNLKILDFFLKNHSFYYFQKKKFFNLKFLLNNKKRQFLKGFFKTSFFVLWSIKKLLKIKKGKKKRKKIYKKIFDYKKKQKKYKFFKIFKIFKKKLYKIFKKTYIHFQKKYLKKYNRLNYIILYNKYRNQYKKKEINKIFKQFENEQQDIEEILDEYDDLPEDRKIKKLKKLNENFEKLKIIYLKKDLSLLNKLIKIKFIKKYNLIKIYKFKLKNKYFFSSKKQTITKQENFKNNFLKFKNNKFNIAKELDMYFFNKKMYLNLLKHRRKNYSFINYKNKNNIFKNNIFKINILYSRLQND